MTTLFDQWVGKAPSAQTLETRLTTPRTHLADRASAVPTVATVASSDGARERYGTLERQARAFLAEHGVPTDHNGFPTDDSPSDDTEQPTATMVARGVLTAIYDDTPAKTSIDLANHDEGFILGGTTGSAVDASDDYVMEWPTLMYAVAHEEQHNACTLRTAHTVSVDGKVIGQYAVALAAPITLTRTNLTATGSQPFTIDPTPNSFTTVVRIDKQPDRSVSKRKRVEGRKPKGEERNANGRSKVASDIANANRKRKRIRCKGCDKAGRAQDPRTQSKPLCTPCANVAFQSLSTTFRS